MDEFKIASHQFTSHHIRSKSNQNKHNEVRFNTGSSFPLLMIDLTWTETETGDSFSYFSLWQPAICCLMSVLSCSFISIEMFITRGAPPHQWLSTLPVPNTNPHWLAFEQHLSLGDFFYPNYTNSIEWSLYDVLHYTTQQCLRMSYRERPI